MNEQPKSVTCKRSDFELDLLKGHIIATWLFVTIFGVVQGYRFGFGTLDYRVVAWGGLLSLLTHALIQGLPLRFGFTIALMQLAILSVYFNFYLAFVRPLLVIYLSWSSMTFLDWVGLLLFFLLMLNLAKYTNIYATVIRETHRPAGGS